MGRVVHRSMLLRTMFAISRSPIFRRRHGMVTHALPEGSPPLRLVALSTARGGRMLFIFSQPTRWRVEKGYALIPLELPGGPAHDDEPDDVAVKRVVRDHLRLDCRLLTSAWTYTPSPRHAVDRHAMTSGQIAPLAET